MTDGPERMVGKRNGNAESSVSELASRAIAALASSRSSGRVPVSEQLVSQLTKAAYAQAETAIQSAITDIRRSGISADEILDFYIPEAARRLGDAWTEDTLGFAEVSIGTARLQRTLRDLAINPRDRGFDAHSTHSLLVSALGSEAHTLGAMTLSEQLRRRNFSVRLLFGEPEHVIVQTVTSGQFHAIFLSAAVVESLAVLRGLIEKLRATAHDNTPILVGGAVCGLGTDIVSLTGADFSTSDVNEAIRLCGLTSSLEGAKARAMLE